MKKAIIRFEDIGPGGYYGTPESLQKLRAMIDYLHSEDVACHISTIPRYIDPAIGYDISVANIYDSYVSLFNDTVKYWISHRKCTLGMHGYTHQFAGAQSGVGFEFYYSGCSENCPPNDLPEACSQREEFIYSYASSRMEDGFKAFKDAGLTIDWGFSTPHYEAAEIQRCILEAWSGLFFENDPLDFSKRTVTIRDTDTPLYRGVIYVPTPLGYVSGSDPEGSIERICRELDSYTSEDVAAFFYHPYLEFPFIKITESGVEYDENSYLKRLIRCFKEKGFTFIPLTDLVPFVPAGRETGICYGRDKNFFIGNMDGDEKDELVIWLPESGTWYNYESNLECFPSRQCEKIMFRPNLLLSYWAAGTYWKPLIGDFDGDGKDDVVVWNHLNGDWQVALSDGLKLVPTGGSWLKPWAAGSYWVPFVGDFDGDGKVDIMVWNPVNGDWQVALSDGTRFVPHPGRGDYSWLKPWAKGSFWVPLVGDFNGDGKDDIVVWDPYNGDWQVALSDGSKFVPSPGRGDYSWLKPWAVGTSWKPLVGDFNGDGINDILVVDIARGDWQVALSTGNRFNPVENAFRPWAAEEEMQPLVGDLNGNGKSALIARYPELRNGTIDLAFSLL